MPTPLATTDLESYRAAFNQRRAKEAAIAEAGALFAAVHTDLVEAEGNLRHLRHILHDREAEDWAASVTAWKNAVAFFEEPGREPGAVFGFSDASTVDSLQAAQKGLAAVEQKLQAQTDLPAAEVRVEQLLGICKQALAEKEDIESGNLIPS